MNETSRSSKSSPISIPAKRFSSTLVPAQRQNPQTIEQHKSQSSYIIYGIIFSLIGSICFIFLANKALSILSAICAAAFLLNAHVLRRPIQLRGKYRPLQGAHAQEAHPIRLQVKALELSKAVRLRTPHAPHQHIQHLFDHHASAPLAPLRRGEQIICEWNYTFPQRGLHNFPATFIQQNIFGFIPFIRALPIEKQQALIFPARGTLQKEAQDELIHYADGTLLETTRLGNEQFLHLRQHQNGDAWRDIHWRASARQDKLITQVRDQHDNQHILLVLDRRGANDKHYQRHFEELLVAAVSIIDFFEEQHLAWEFRSWPAEQTTEKNKKEIIQRTHRSTPHRQSSLQQRAQCLKYLSLSTCLAPEDRINSDFNDMRFEIGTDYHQHTKILCLSQFSPNEHESDSDHFRIWNLPYLRSVISMGRRKR